MKIWVVGSGSAEEDREEMVEREASDEREVALLLRMVEVVVEWFGECGGCQMSSTRGDVDGAVVRLPR